MKISVAVLFGGKTVEHEISVISAVQAMGYLDKEKYELIPVYMTKSGKMYTGEKLTNIENYRNIQALLKDCRQVIMTNLEGRCVLLPYPMKLGWKKQVKPAAYLEKDFAKIFPKSSDEELVKFLCDAYGMGELTGAEKASMQKALIDQRDPEIAGKKKKLFQHMYGYCNPVVTQMMRLRDARCGISWTTFSHTPRQVLTNAKGTGQEYFKDVKDNTEISRAISKAMLGENVIDQKK